MIDEFTQYLMSIENQHNRDKLSDILEQLHAKYPNLTPKMSWGMTVFLLNGTYIIGISAFKEHFSVAPEPIAVSKFAKEIAAAGYKSTKGLFKIKWTDNIDWNLLCGIIEFNMTDKANCKTFWR